MMHKDNHTRIIGRCQLLSRLLAAVGLLLTPGLYAAEFTAELQFVDARGMPVAPVGEQSHTSVRLYPLENQALPARTPGKHELLISKRSVKPVLLTVVPGAQLEFSNHDEIYHELVLQSNEHKHQFSLKRQGDADDHVQVTLKQAGSWHVFCRIHHTLYGRVDVVETPYYQTLIGKQRVRFTKLQPGLWRIEAVTLGGAQSSASSQAFTSPLPVQLKLPVASMRRIRNHDESLQSDVNALFGDVQVNQ